MPLGDWLAEGDNHERGGGEAGPGMRSFPGGAPRGNQVTAAVQAPAGLQGDKK